MKDPGRRYPTHPRPPRRAPRTARPDHGQVGQSRRGRTRRAEGVGLPPAVEDRAGRLDDQADRWRPGRGAAATAGEPVAGDGEVVERDDAVGEDLVARAAPCRRSARRRRIGPRPGRSRWPACGRARPGPCPGDGSRRAGRRAPGRGSRSGGCPSVMTTRSADDSATSASARRVSRSWSPSALRTRWTRPAATARTAARAWESGVAVWAPSIRTSKSCPSSTASRWPATFARLSRPATTASRSMCSDQARAAAASAWLTCRSPTS